ncbi:retention module-containing protein [Aeromonas veronii]|nr:retention module-containing protein [Aeromonas veronii]
MDMRTQIIDKSVVVSAIEGNVEIVLADGSSRPLQKGEILQPGAKLAIADDAKLALSPYDDTPASDVPAGSESAEPAQPQVAASQEGAPSDIAALQESILQGVDPTQNFEASAAGGAPAAGGGGGIGGVAGASGNGGFVTIDRTGDATIAAAGFDTTYDTAAVINENQTEDLILENQLDDLGETAVTLEDTQVSGNLLDNSTNPDGPADASIVSYDWGINIGVPAGVAATITGVGTLIINPDGSYTFTPAPNYDGVVPPVSYQVTDGQDTVTSTLVISITPVDEEVSLDGLTQEGGEVLVSDANLADGSAPNDAALTQSGVFTFNAPDGVQTLAIGAIQLISNGTVVALPVSIETPLGNGLQITAITYDPVTGNGSVSYSYTLGDNENHTRPVNDTSLSESFSVVLIDSDGDTASDNLDVTILDDVPVVELADGHEESLRVDETVRDDGENDETAPAWAGLLGSVLGYASADASALFDTSDTGSDGGSTAYSLTAADGEPLTDGTASGVYDTETSEQIYLFINASGEVEGRVGAGVDSEGEPTGQVAFVLRLDGAELELAQFRAVEHNDDADHDESGDEAVFLTDGVVFVTATTTDGDGDTDSASADLADLVAFEDDGPVVELADGHEESLRVDETVRDDGENDETAPAWAGLLGSVLGYASADASALFDTSDTGSDGGSTAYSLTAADGEPLTDGTASGVYDTETSEQIYLFINASGEVEGRVGAGVDSEGEPTGQVAFVLRLDGAELELAQFRAVEHNDDADHDESGDEAVFLTDGVVFVTATTTDGDGDTDSASADLADLVAFEDDGPVVELADGHEESLRVDETVRDDGENDETAPAWAGLLGSVLGYASADASALFDTSDTGSDGGSTAYSLTAADGEPLTDGTASGVYDTETSEQIYLFINASGEVEGRVGAGVDSEGEPTGQVAFVLRLDGAELELAQFRAVEHNDDADHDESGDEAVFLTDGVVFVTATTTDGDGDTDSASADLADLVAFEDDGPVVELADGHEESLRVDETVRDDGENDETAPAWAGLLGSVLGYASADASALFDTSDTGSDGGSTAYSLTAADGEPLTDGTASGVYDTETSEQIYLFINASGEVEGRVGAGVDSEGEPTGQVAFVLRLDGAELELAQFRAVEHNDDADHDESGDEAVFLTDGVVFVTATTTDGDGDTDSASADLADLVAFEDDGPVVELADGHEESLRVDETVRDDGENDETAPAWAGLLGSVLGYASADASALFDTSDTGSDGGSTAYSLTAADGEPLTDGTASGVYDTETSEQIYLFINASGEVEGRVGAGVDSEGEPTGQVAFVLRLDGAELELAQFRAVEHNDDADHDESGDEAVFLTDGVVFVTATTTDGDGDTDSASADLADLVAFEDDGPVALNDNPICIMQSPLPLVNVTLVLDTSGSMRGDKLAALKAAVVNLAQAYAGLDAPIHVNLVTFATGSSNVGDYNFNSVSDSGYINLISAVNALSADGWTNYAEALNTAKAQILLDVNNVGADKAQQNKLYFISDGNPEPDPTGQVSAITAWQTFITNGNVDNDNNSETNPFQAHAIGINVNTGTYLNPISSSGTYILASPENLSATLVDLASAGGGVIGNVLANDNSGADGVGLIASVSVGAQTFTINASGTDIDILGAGGVTHSFDKDTKVLSLNTELGILKIDLQGTHVGEYSFVAKANLSPAIFGDDGAVKQLFTYTLVDGDGDKAPANLEICIRSNQSVLVVGHNVSDIDSSLVAHHIASPFDSVTGGVIQGVAGNDVLIGDVGGSTRLPGQKANIVYVLDNSGSMDSTIPFTNIQGVTTNISRLDALKQSVIASLNNLYESGASDIKVHLVKFGTNAPVGSTFTLTANGIDNLEQLNNAIAFVNAIMANGGYTNYEAGLVQANNWIQSSAPVLAADVNKVLFVSDGAPNRALDNSGSVIPADAQTAIKHVLGTAGNNDNVSEVGLIETAGPGTAQAFTIEAVGINVSASAQALLNDVEGSGGLADNVITANQLMGIIGNIAGGLINVAVVGNDALRGGDGVSIHRNSIDTGKMRRSSLDPTFLLA